jgi:para-nitrobenzyl esterase
VHAYLGVPFAAPPVGELRWRAPQPVKAWAGVFNADSLRTSCAGPGQGNTEFRGEDCLNLNIWEPATAKVGAKIPVVVWIHGGGFQGGSPNIAMYSGEPFAKKGLIYVGISYRLGVFGFLSHPELTKEAGQGAPGNWGMLDQVAALKWIQRNIAAFGGDPANVTIMGESAGSESVHLLQASPMTKGLYAKATGWSGAITPPGNQNVPTLSEAEALGMKIQEALHARNLAEMRAIPWDRVLAAVTEPRQRRPVLDGVLLPQLPVDIFRAGKQNDVPTYVSSTAKDKGGSDEFYEVKTLFDLQTLAKQAFADQSEEFFRLFPASSDAEAVKQAQVVVAGNGFGIANRDWARQQALSGKQPAYLAQFARVSPYPPGATGRFTIGAAHSTDIVYWLGTQDTQPRFGWTAWDRELSATMMDSLIAFAKTGNPSTATVRIPRYDPRTEQRVVFGDKIWVENLSTAQLEFLRAHPTSGSQQ